MPPHLCDVRYSVWCLTLYVPLPVCCIVVSTLIPNVPVIVFCIPFYPLCAFHCPGCTTSYHRCPHPLCARHCTLSPSRLPVVVQTVESLTINQLPIIPDVIVIVFCITFYPVCLSLYWLYNPLPSPPVFRSLYLLYNPLLSPCPPPCACHCTDCTIPYHHCPHISFVPVIVLTVQSLTITVPTPCVPVIVLTVQSLTITIPTPPVCPSLYLLCNPLPWLSPPPVCRSLYWLYNPLPSLSPNHFCARHCTYCTIPYHHCPHPLCARHCTLFNFLPSMFTPSSIACPDFNFIFSVLNHSSLHLILQECWIGSISTKKFDNNPSTAPSHRLFQSLYVCEATQHEPVFCHLAQEVPD